MNLLLPLVYILFIAPIFVRFAVRREPGNGNSTGILAEMRAGIRNPPMVLHLIGGLVVGAGLAFAYRAGRITRAISLNGVLGAALIVLGAALLVWSFAAFRSWRLLPKVDAGHQLCTTGPYAIVRHPMYLAIDFAAVGTALCVPTVPVVIGAILMIAGGDARARAEEKALLAAFGNRYRDYMARVSRLLPGRPYVLRCRRGYQRRKLR
jgi:protein-S-isoprenylcysteine O-methyltransferase Ste14